ncbi:hypothetical protein ACI2JR_07310 [Klebsiella sp. NPDC088457]
MFSSLKKLFNSGKVQGNTHDAEAEKVKLELSQLEAALAENPADNATQKLLMVKYNQAIKIYAASKDYRNCVDDVFVKIDELRNTIRKNI